MKLNFFTNSKKSEDSSEIIDPISQTKNWYSDKYEAVIIQRNILLLITICSMIITVVGTVVIGIISTSKKIEPFIVEVEDKTGLTTIVNPLNDRMLTTSKSLNTYFILKFLKAYETYSEFELSKNVNTVRVLTKEDKIYDKYKKMLKDANTSPINKYGKEFTTSLKIRSMIFNDDDETIVTVRFSVIENEREKKLYNKIANIKFTYNQTEMVQDDREINPIGFQILEYAVSDETL